MRSRKNKVHKFLAVWDMLGLESLHDISAWEKNRKVWEKGKVWSILTEKDHTEPPPGPNLNLLLLRARYNSQRQYEIYLFETNGLDFDDVKASFEDEPQFMADFIRKNGTKIYSDYVPSGNKTIA